MGALIDSCSPKFGGWGGGSPGCFDLYLLLDDLVLGINANIPVDQSVLIDGDFAFAVFGTILNFDRGSVDNQV
jgi:hypothetical protein